MPKIFNETQYQNLLSYCETDSQRDRVENIHQLCSAQLRFHSETRRVIYRNAERKEIVQVYVREQSPLILIRLPAASKMQRVIPNKTFRYGFQLQDDGCPSDRVHRYKKDELRAKQTYRFNRLQQILLGQQTQQDVDSALMMFVQLALDGSQ